MEPKASNTKGNILKDTFYKQRLLRSQNSSGFNNRQARQEQSSTDSKYTPEQQILDMRQHLSNFSKTSHSGNYAFLNFTCTHKMLQKLKRIKQYIYLQNIEVSYNKLRSLKHLSGLKYLISIKASNNHLTSIMQLKVPPLHLDRIDLSFNQISSIPDLAIHKHLRILNLKSNKISNIQGLSKNKKLTILDLSQNSIEEVKGLDHLNLTQLYLGNNQIQTVKGFTNLQSLRVLDLSINKITKIGGLVGLISLRDLNLAKNNIKHVRQIDFLQNLMYLTCVDMCFNPIQQKKYYRLQVIYKLPMLKKLDGTQLTGNEVVNAQKLYGLDVQEKFNIFKTVLPEEQFIDRRINTSEMISDQSQPENQHNNLLDQYDEEGRKTNSNKSKNQSFAGSKRSNFSKGSKQSKRSVYSKG